MEVEEDDDKTKGVHKDPLMKDYPFPTTRI